MKLDALVSSNFLQVANDTVLFSPSATILATDINVMPILSKPAFCLLAHLIVPCEYYG